MNAKAEWTKLVNAHRACLIDCPCHRCRQGIECFLLESDIAQIIQSAQREVLEDVKPLLEALSNSYGAVEWPADGTSNEEKIRDAFLAKYPVLSDSERERK